MPKDRIGNELKEGDLVMVSLPSTQAIGKITMVKKGGIIAAIKGMAGGKKGLAFTPDTVKVLFDFDFAWNDPNNPHSDNMVKLVDPDKIADGIGDAAEPSKILH